MEYKSKILKWITLFVFALSVFLVNKIDANASDVPELQWKDGYIYWDEVHTRNNSSTVWFSVSKWEVSVIIDGVTYSGSIPYNSWNYNVTKTVGTKTTKYVYACKISEETFCTYLKNSSGTVLTPTQLENAYSSYILFNAVTIVHKANDMSTIYNENGQTEFRRADWLDGAACGWSFGHPPDTTLKTGGYWGMEVKVVKNENIKYTLTVNGTNTSEVWIKNSSGTKVATGTTSTSYRDKVNTVVSYGATALKGYHFGTSGTSTKSVSSYTITKPDTKPFLADANVLTVKYNANGGTGSIGNTTMSYGTANCTLTSSQPTREHYQFVGWNTKKDGTGTWVYPTTTEGCLDVGIKAKAEEWSYALGASIYEHSDNSVTLYAQWKINTLDIFYLNVDSSATSDGENLCTFGDSAYGAGWLDLTYRVSDNTFVNSPFKYTDTSIDLYNISTLGFVRTGYHTDASDAWKIRGEDFFIQQTSANTDSIIKKLKSYIETSHASIVLVPNWKPNTLTVTYDANGGTFGSGATTTQSMNYDSSYQLLETIPSRAGYTFKGWTASSSWNNSYTKYTKDSASQTAQDWAQSFDVQDNNSDDDSTCIDSVNNTITLYAQWEKTNTYTIHYLTSNGTQASQSFSVTFRNDATSASVTSFTNGNYYYIDSLTSVVFSGNTSISSFKDNSTVTKNGYSDWVERGIAKGDTSSTATTIGSTLSVSASESGTINYYATYQRKPTITFYDYATNTLKKRTLTGSVTIGGVTYDTAGMKYNGTVDRKPVFTFPTQNTMVYGEALTSGVKKNETWTSNGWSLDKTAKAKSYTNGSSLNMGTSYVSSSGTSKMASYGDYTYYGNYSKSVKLTYNANSGSVGTSYNSYTRYANINSSTPTTTKTTYNIPNAYYKDASSGLTIYTQGSWTYVAPSKDNNYWINNEDYKSVMAFNNIGTGYYSDNKTIWQYAPLVTETVYATWTNESNDVTVLKDAVWDNPDSDDLTVDFEGLENIDIDGIAKVTLTVTLNPSSTQYVANNLYIEDYYNTDMWDFVSSSTNNFGVDTSGTNAGTIKWTIGNVTVNKKTTITATYYLKLKEEYWTIDADGNKVTDNVNYYINPMNGKGTYAKSVQAYLDSLSGTVNSDGTYDVKNVALNRNDLYYKESAKSHKSYVYVNYHYDNNVIDGTQRYVAYPVDYVQMRDVDWKPEVSTDISISSDTNNIYQVIGADNTYFVQYDTRSTDSSNSIFKLNMNSMLDRSSSFYQITNNILNISNTTKGDIDNFIAVDSSNANLVFDSNLIPSTKQKSYTYTTDNSILKVKSALSIRSSVAKKLDNRTAYYLNGAVSTQDIVYATNQDGLTFDIVPNVLITDADDNKEYLFADASKKITLTIDATNPIITADSRIRTQSEDNVKWTASDGYVDINLVDSKTNPEPKTHTLTFEFKDEVSGINSPNASTNDWIGVIKDNVQVTLVNVDSGKTVFDYNTSTYGSIVSVKYNTINNMNKTGSVSVTLDPNNEDLLGHLQLTIKVIDNVGNWETKTYDIYSFCLTGNVNVVDTLPSADERNEAEIWNGEQGKIQISANGYVDRVKVDFEYSLVQASQKELIKRNNITGDEYKINGDYPYDDSNLTATKETVTYLASKYLKCKWGYLSGEIGGMPLSLAELATTEYTLNNSILNAHLDELIANYIANETGGYVQNVSGNNYAIYGTTLYTYPIYSGDTMKSYLDSYTLEGSVIMNEKPYPVNVIINGSKYATINYTETEDGYKASIEAQTIFESEWVKVGNEYLKPLVHYFYMPTYAEVRNGENANDHYIVQLTAYKDSGTDFVHSVSIQLTMTNDNYGGSLKDLQTIIKDN